MTKLVLKKDKSPTGLASIGWRPGYDILYKRGKIGDLQETVKYSDLYKIRFTVIKEDINEDGNPNCSWTWKTYTKGLTMDEVKKYLENNIKAILKLPLHGYNNID